MELKLIIEDGKEKYIPLTVEDLAQREIDRIATEEEQAKPKPPTIEEQLVEKDKQIFELKIKQVETNQMVAENGVMQQDLLELLIDMGVI